MKASVRLWSSAIALVSLCPVSVFSQSVEISSYPDLGAVLAREGYAALAVSSAADMAAVDSVASGLPVARRCLPVNLTAEDFITKVYGVLSPESSRVEICEDCANVLNLRPSEYNMGLWLDSADGYQLNYYGMAPPDVSAMASIERDSVANFGFFFMFPYDGSNREEMNLRQAQFCGSLLQEMQDIGAVLGVNADTDSLFEVSGSYKGNFVEVRLIDEAAASGRGRYVLFLSVEPRAFIPADNLAAQ